MKWHSLTALAVCLLGGPWCPSLATAQSPNLQQSPEQLAPLSMVDVLVDNAPAIKGTLQQLILRRHTADQRPRLLGSELPAPTPGAPAQLFYARIFKRFLEDHVERRFSGRWPVDETILGTRFVGEADIRGEMEMVLLPTGDKAIAEVEFAGTIVSRTRGFNGPAVLHNVADTPFKTRATITFCDSGLAVAAARSIATTISTTSRIETRRRGLIGRAVQRVAWRRAGELRHETDRIANELAIAQINRVVDTRIAESIVAVQAALKAQLPHAPYGQDQRPPQVTCRSTPEYMEIVMHRPEASPAEMQMQPPEAAAGADVAVRAHRLVLFRAATDPQVLRTMGPLIADLMRAGNVPQVLTAAASPSEQFQVSWTDDREWLVIDYDGADAPTEKPHETLTIEAMPIAARMR